MENSQKKLSVCILCYNEAQLLKECIHQAKRVGDEVIVIDLESTDRTRQVASEEQVRWYSIPWNHSFSELKNYGMSLAEGRWVLFLQAYERFSEQELSKIQVALVNPNVEGYLLYMDYQLEEYSIYTPNQCLRLLRNRKEYQYRYRSYEQIEDEELRNIEDLPLTLHCIEGSHIPWDLQWRMEELQRELIKEETSPYLNYVYGTLLLNKQEFEESRKYFERAVTTVNMEYLYVPHLYKCLILDCIILGHQERALELLEEGISFFSYYRDYYILRAELYRQKKQYEEAIVDLNTCIGKEERPTYLVPSPDLKEDIALEALGDLYKELFYYDQALACYQKIKESVDQKDLEDEFYIETARSFVESNQLDRVLELEQEIQENEEKQQYEEMVAGLWIYYEQYSSAKQYISLHTNLNQEKLFHITWLNEKCWELKKMIEELRGMRNGDPSDAMRKAWQNCIIGDYFLDKGRISAAVLAYIRALEAEPLCDRIEIKLHDITKKNELLLPEVQYQLKPFRFLLDGIEAFYEGDFTTAVISLEKAASLLWLEDIVAAYSISMEWIKGNTIDLEKHEFTIPFIQKVLCICKNYLLCQTKKLGELNEYGGLVQRVEMDLTGLKIE